MLKLYSEIAVPNTSAQNDQQRNSSFTEKHLQALWFEQRFFYKLKTSQGEEIQVLSPGIWNTQSGPDFLKAHFKIGKKFYRGDIEIHFSDDDWYQHGHHLDKQYNQVILHVSYLQSTRSAWIQKENGGSPFHCYLNGSLSHSENQLMNIIDLDCYPRKQYSNQGACAEQLFPILTDKKIQDLFQSASYWRLEKKAQYLQKNLPDNRPMQFAGGIAMAMGYQHNARAFFDLFCYLLEYRDLPYEELLSIALGSCGFLEHKYHFKWENSTYYQHLRALWWGRKDQIIHQTNLKVDRIRPLHHPIRRLAYLLKLLQDPNLEQLWNWTLKRWETAEIKKESDYKKLLALLLEVLPNFRDPYWDYHFLFELTPRTNSLPGLGKELKMHLLLNTTLPLLYSTLKVWEDVKQWQKFQQFYAMLVIPLTKKSRYLHHRFFGERKGEKFLKKAQMSQGAYQLHHDFCTHFEASCKGCPFVERYQNLEFITELK